MTLHDAAVTAIQHCLDLQPTESCLIVTDDHRLPIGEELYAVASEVTDHAVLERYPPGSQHGAEPPAPVAAAMHAADVVLAPTTKSLTHTRARQRASENGARIATLPGITEDVMIAGLDADYDAIAAACQDLYNQLTGAAEVRVTTPAGTDITVEPGDRQWRQDTGIVHDAGDTSNLPAGEVFVSPVNANGTYVVDGTMMPHGLVEEPFAITVKHGAVTDVEDEAVREAIDEAAMEVGDGAYNLAELGIGANVGVTELVGSVLLDEKAAGTVHVAVGDDAGIGGDTDAPIHLDAVLREPTVYADGRTVTLPTE
jgi:leucyl aminopeptidase (aminopeptidase T)